MKGFSILFSMIFIFVLAGCSTAKTTEPAESNKENMVEASVDEAQTQEAEMSDPVFNKESLSAYNGKDGNKAYIAIDGVVYDVTDEPMWMDGIHRGRFEAGQDLTEEMKNAPHGLSKLKSLEAVGTYED